METELVLPAAEAWEADGVFARDVDDLIDELIGESSVLDHEEAIDQAIDDLLG